MVFWKYSSSFYVSNLFLFYISVACFFLNMENNWKLLMMHDVFFALFRSNSTLTHFVLDFPSFQQMSTCFERDGLFLCIVGQKKSTPLLIPIKTIVQKWNLYNQYALLSTSIWCLKICHRDPSTWGYLLNFNFFNVNSQICRRNCNVHRSNCLDKKFHNISDIPISSKIIRALAIVRKQGILT